MTSQSAGGTDMSTPTETAESSFQFAMNVLQQVKTNSNDEVNLYVRSALSNMAWGLKNLSVGVRATYVLPGTGAEGIAAKQPGAPTMNFR
jgi:hypothetical protein